ncbi:MAG: hypothetical protein ACRBF0_11655 [Calditrichia bacterium]
MRTLFFILLSFTAAAFPQGKNGPIQLTDTPADERYPTWSADGKKILFESKVDSSWGIFLLMVDERRIEKVLDTPRNERFPAFSPKNESIVLQSDLNGQPDLYIYDLVSNNLDGITQSPESEMMPHWSPGGKSIVYCAAVEGNIDLFSFTIGVGVKRIEIPATSTTATDSAIDPGSFRNVWPRYSPDGSQIAFFSRRDTEGKDDEIYILSVADQSLQRVTNSPGHDFCPSWSPDGKFIASAKKESEDIRYIQILDLQGKVLQKMGEGFNRVTEPSWSPDGKHIAYIAKKNKQYDIYIEVVNYE